MAYFLRNKRTGWTGSVTEKIYRDRLRHPDQYESWAPEGVSAETPKVEPYTHESVAETKRSFEKAAKAGGWFDVVGDDGQVVNDKSLREADADKLIEELTNE